MTPRRRARKDERYAWTREIRHNTSCAKCGRRPIEWHNPDHAQRPEMRISNMVNNNRTKAAILAEMQRCTPLCRGCHMRADGRMENLKQYGGVGR